MYKRYCNQQRGGRETNEAPIYSKAHAIACTALKARFFKMGSSSYDRVTAPGPNGR